MCCFAASIEWSLCGIYVWDHGDHGTRLKPGLPTLHIRTRSRRYDRHEGDCWFDQYGIQNGIWPGRSEEASASDQVARLDELGTDGVDRDGDRGYAGLDGGRGV